MTQTTDPSVLDALQQKGVLVQAHVRYWRGRKKLKPEDLGLEPSSIDQNLIALGQKRLLTKEALSAFALIEGRAHALVEASSFPFLRVARYVPNERLADLTERLDALKRDFDRETRLFLANYGRFRDEAMTAWRTAALDLGVDPYRLLRTIEDAFPIDVAPAFSFGYQLFQVTAPEEISTAAYDLALSEEVRKARRKAAEEANLRIRTSAESFITESVAALREETTRLCDDVLSTIQGGNVNQKTLNRLDRFVERFQSLNFVGDAEMERKLDEFRAEFLNTGAAEYRSSSKARFGLVEGLSRLRSEANRLANVDARDMVQRFGEQGRRKFGRAV